MHLERAVPVRQVADVGRSMRWYAAVFGFEPDPFSKDPRPRLRNPPTRVCVSGAVPAAANVPAARECEETAH
jgi:hypothetical protein